MHLKSLYREMYVFETTFVLDAQRDRRSVSNARK